MLCFSETNRTKSAGSYHVIESEVGRLDKGKK